VPDCRPPIQPAPHPGRYHRVGDPWPLYGAIEESTVWAEWSRATDGGVAPEDDPRWLCVFEADLRVLDLRRPEVLEALEVSEQDVVGDWAPDAPNLACLRVAAAATIAGADAIVVPSAALPGGWNLAVLPGGFARLRRLTRRQRRPAPPDLR
jgi:RES domain-containing protein